MTKAKTSIALATLICALAALTSPASAFFEASTASATSGPIAKLPSFTFSISVGGKVVATVACSPGTTATGLWQIQNSEETVVTTGTKEQHQPVTKVGPHEAITITNWGTCTAELGAEKAAVTLSPCRIAVAQVTKSTVANQAGFGSIQTSCVIKAPTLVCTITIEQLPANHSLKAISLANVAAGVEINADVSGLTYKGEGVGCTTVGITEGKEFSVSTPSEAIVTAGQKLI